MSKFKKGDKVKVIKKGRGGWKGVGLIGEVVNGNDGTSYLPYKVEFPDGVKTKDGITYGHYDEGDLELVELIDKRINKLTHMILWDNNYHIAYGKKDRDEKIKGLVDNKDINNDNITILDIKSKSKINCDVITEEIK